ncbi:MAG: hypothetical protein ACFCVE_11675 [Phycisphaerae bacterium]
MSILFAPFLAFELGDVIVLIFFVLFWIGGLVLSWAGKIQQKRKREEVRQQIEQAQREAGTHAPSQHAPPPPPKPGSGRPQWDLGGEGSPAERAQREAKERLRMSVEADQKRESDRRERARERDRQNEIRRTTEDRPYDLPSTRQSRSDQRQADRAEAQVASNARADARESAQNAIEKAGRRDNSRKDPARKDPARKDPARREMAAVKSGAAIREQDLQRASLDDVFSKDQKRRTGVSRNKLRGLLAAGTLREAFVLTELLQPPMALRKHAGGQPIRED